MSKSFYVPESRGDLFILKSLVRTNVLNDVTAAPFLVGFLQLAAEKKTSKPVQL